LYTAGKQGERLRFPNFFENYTIYTHDNIRLTY